MKNPSTINACWIVWLPMLSALLCVSGCSPEETGCPRVGACCQDEELVLDECCRWEPMESRSMTRLAGIWGTSNHRMFVVGDHGSIQGFDGKEWNIFYIAESPLSPKERLRAIDGVGDFVYAVGEYPPLRLTGDIFVNDGHAPDLGEFYDICAVGSEQGGDLFLSSIYGSIVNAKLDSRTGLVTWSNLDHQVTDYDLTSIVAASITALTAVGTSGVVLEYDGLDWQERYPLGEQHFTKIFLHRDVRYIVGENGVFLRELDGGWEVIDTDTTRDLQSIWVGWNGLHRQTCAYMVGEYGTILLMDQGPPRPMQSGTTEHLNDVWGFSCHDVYAVGDSGTILKLTCSAQKS